MRTLYEVSDFRKGQTMAPVAVLEPRPGALLAWGVTGETQHLPIEDDDDLEIEGAEITIHTKDGAIVFTPIEAESDALEFLGLTYSDAWMGCLL